MRPVLREGLLPRGRDCIEGKHAMASQRRGVRGARVWRVVAVMVAASRWVVPCWGQLEFERAPISYHQAEVSDPVARLQAKIDAGRERLEYDADFGYLKSLLERLDVPISSQGLVYSKTSFQLKRIDPRHPRAVYFNDRVYIGFVQQGDVLEVASVDPRNGVVFYTLSQRRTDRPKFVRDRGQCLTCHASSRTAGVPGVLVRSVLVSPAGQLMLGTRAYTTDHRSPLRERWGGWYITGRHGSDYHMGNITIARRSDADQIDLAAHANLESLDGLVDTAPYLSPYSDLVALMVLEHQTQVQNRITRAHFETRIARHYDQVMNEMLERPDDYQSDTTKRRIDRVAEQLVDYLLLVDEYHLVSPVRGPSRFAEEFQQRGPRDHRGRSLRDLDLKTRLFKYPCSYLIYSPSFDALPSAVRRVVYDKLWAVLTGKDTRSKYSHLSPADRRAILEILRETKPNLPASWRATSAPKGEE